METAIRLFKENVLHRKQAYNAIEIIDFVINEMTVYYQRRLNDFAIFRNTKNDLEFDKITKLSEKINTSSIEICGNNTFLVPSCSNPDILYAVDMETGNCSCEYGMYGKFCKHMAAIYAATKVALPNFPVVTVEERKLMAWLAFGNEAMSTSFYKSLHNDHFNVFRKVFVTCFINFLI